MRKTLIVLTILFLLLFVGLVQAAHFNQRRWLAWTLSIVIINIDPRINFYTENGYSLNSELCHGQRFKVAMETPTGEWVAEGGHHDSPAITWVENLQSFLNKTLEAGSQSTAIPISELYDGYVDEAVGVPVYKMKYIQSRPQSYINLVCEVPKLFTSLDVSGADPVLLEKLSVADGGELSDIVFGVTATDKVDISYAGDLNCVFYWFCRYEYSGCKLYRTTYDLKLGSISDKKFITVIDKPSQPKINLTSILTDTQLSPQSSTYMKLTITNSGNKTATIKEINLNVNSEFLACTSMKLSPEETTECVLSVSPEQSFVIEANVKYQFQMCGERQEKTERFLVGYIEVEATECSSSSDCSENYECCKGLCYDSTKGMCADVNADGVPEWVPIE